MQKYGMGSPIVPPLAPDREVSLVGAGEGFDTFPDTNLKPPVTVGS